MHDLYSLLVKIYQSWMDRHAAVRLMAFFFYFHDTENAMYSLQLRISPAVLAHVLNMIDELVKTTRDVSVSPEHKLEFVLFVETVAK